MFAKHPVTSTSIDNSRALQGRMEPPPPGGRAAVPLVWTPESRVAPWIISSSRISLGPRAASGLAVLVSAHSFSFTKAFGYFGIRAVQGSLFPQAALFCCNAQTPGLRELNLPPPPAGPAL